MRHFFGAFNPFPQQRPETARWRYVDSEDLAKVRLWGREALEIWEGSESVRWRNEATGVAIVAGFCLVGLAVLDWSFWQIVFLWYADLLALWFGDVLKVCLAPTEVKCELSKAHRSFVVWTVVDTLRARRAGRTAGAPMVRERLLDGFSVFWMLIEPFFLIFCMGLAVGQAVIDRTLLLWVLASFLWHLGVALKVVWRAKVGDRPEPQLLAQSQLPHYIGISTFFVFYFLIWLALLVELEFVLLLSYLMSAALVSVWLQRIARRRVREVRDYLSKSTAEQEAELRTMSDGSLPSALWARARKPGD